MGRNSIKFPASFSSAYREFSGQEKQGTAIPSCQELCFSPRGDGRGREGAWVPPLAPRVISDHDFTRKMSQERKPPLPSFPNSLGRAAGLGNVWELGVV